MFPRSFDYFSPSSLAQALDVLRANEGNVKVLAGGQSLIPALKLRNIAPKNVVDISRIKALSYIRRGADELRIGATTTTAVIEHDSTVASLFPVLTDAASTIADPLVRNLGTVGGDLCYGDPSNDFPAAMIALNATFNISGKDGNRLVSAESFFLGKFKTDVKQDEVLIGITIPVKDGKVGSAYQKVRKGSGGFTIAGVAVNLALDESNNVTECNMALTALADRPFRALEAAEVLVGKPFEVSALEEASRVAVAASKPVSDINASAEYRRKVLRLLVKDALGSAYKRAVMGKYDKS